MSGQPESFGPRNDHRHRHIHAGHGDTADFIGQIACRKKRAGRGSGNIHEIEFHRRRRARNAINGGLAIIMDGTVRCLNTRHNPRAGIHGPDPHLGNRAGRLDQPHFQRRRTDTGKDVAACRLEIDKLVLDTDLREEIVDIGPFLLRA